VIVAVPTYLLSAGNFPTRVAATAGSRELEGQGISSIVIERSLRGELP
jgi:hypothetical protein